MYPDILLIIIVIGVVMVLLGMFLVFISMFKSVRRAEPGDVSVGGFMIVGPIPIAFGWGRSAIPLIVIGIVLTIIAILLTFILPEMLFKHGWRPPSGVD